MQSADNLVEEAQYLLGRCRVLGDLRLERREVREFLFGAQATNKANAHGFTGGRCRAAKNMRLKERCDFAGFDGWADTVIRHGGQGLALEDDFDGIHAVGGLEFGLPSDVDRRKVDGSADLSAADDHAFGLIGSQEHGIGEIEFALSETLSDPRAAHGFAAQLDGGDEAHVQAGLSSVRDQAFSISSSSAAILKI